MERRRARVHRMIQTLLRQNGRGPGEALTGQARWSDDQVVDGSPASVSVTSETNCGARDSKVDSSTPLMHVHESGEDDGNISPSFPPWRA